MSARITMRQIAAAAGVSVATVSMALRNSEKITPETRAKVREVAEKLNYRPDPLIAALAGRRRERNLSSLDIIAYVTAYPTKEGWRANRFAPAAYDGACARAAQRGYRIEHFWLRDEQMTTRRLANILQARGILGRLFRALPRRRAAVHLRLGPFLRRRHRLHHVASVPAPRLSTPVPRHAAHAQYASPARL